MNLKIGDKVKFLNQNGGGVVIRILSPQMVSVAIEDGFEIPTMVNELLKVEPQTGSAKLFQNDTIFPSTQAVEALQESVENDFEYERISPLKKIFNASQVSKGIYLAFEPHEQRWLLTGKMDVYLLNHTPYDFFFSLFLRDLETNDFIGRDYDVLPPYSKVLLATINRDEIGRWSRGVVQGLFHADSAKSVLNPMNAEFKIKEMRFLKDENYRIIPVLEGKALVVALADLADIAVFAENKTEPLPQKEILNAGIIPSKGKILKNALLDIHKTDAQKVEVDLHIDELSETPAFLNPGEILAIQLDYFEKCLNAAIENHLEQITFIHGVGTGKLKSEIIQILKQYEGLHWFDAPMSRYGVGATDVLIGQNVKRTI